MFIILLLIYFEININKTSPKLKKLSKEPKTYNLQLTLLIMINRDIMGKQLPIILFILFIFNSIVAVSQPYNSELEIINTPDWLIEQNKLRQSSDLKLIIFDKPSTEMFDCSDIRIYVDIDGCSQSLWNDYKFMEDISIEEYTNGNLICRNYIDNIMDRVGCGAASLDKFWSLKIYPTNGYESYFEPIEKNFEIISESKFKDLGNQNKLKNITIPLAVVLFFISILTLYNKKKTISILGFIISFVIALLPYIIY